MRRALREIRILARDPLLLFLVAMVFVLVGLFVVFPLAKVAIASLQTRGGV
jgi:iron(III) transport system permease protein